MIDTSLLASFFPVSHLIEMMGVVGTTRWDEADLFSHSRILLAGQERSARTLEMTLRRQHAQVRWVLEPAKLAKLLDHWCPQLLILLEWGDLWCEALGESQAMLQHVGTTVMALGPDREEDAMAALQAGVSAYVGSLQGESLVLAQASALLRRGHQWELGIIDIPGVLRIDPQSHRVFVQGQELQLSRRIFRLFHYLAQRSEYTVSTLEITQQLAGNKGVVHSNTIAAQIHRLRKALEEVGADRWLQTVHGIGYRLTLPTASESKSKKAS